MLLAFAFLDAPLQSEPGGVPGVQAVLPRWQLSRQGQHCWLRLQRPIGGGVTPRQLAEELWEQARSLERLVPDPCTPDRQAPKRVGLRWSSSWQERYRSKIGDEAYAEAAPPAFANTPVVFDGEELESDSSVRKPRDPLRPAGWDYEEYAPDQAQRPRKKQKASAPQ